MRPQLPFFSFGRVGFRDVAANAGAPQTLTIALGHLFTVLAHHCKAWGKSARDMNHMKIEVTSTKLQARPQQEGRHSPYLAIRRQNQRAPLFTNDQNKSPMTKPNAISPRIKQREGT